MYKDNKGNEVKPKKYTWKVVYKDGSTLEQFENGQYHYISEVDFGSVERLIVNRFEDKQNIFTTLVTPETKLFIYHYITKPHWSKVFLRTEVFGLKWKGSSNAVYVHILPDQNVVISPHDKVDIGQHIIDNSNM